MSYLWDIDLHPHFLLKSWRLFLLKIGLKLLGNSSQVVWLNNYVGESNL